MSEKIIAYKAMNPDMTCRGKKYEVGKTYFEDKADCCNAGMHACENPFEVLRYYPMKDNPRFFEVECGGEISKSDKGSKPRLYGAHCERRTELCWDAESDS
ncbi:MAG: hypothetical protein ACLUFD_08620 [Faecalibacterium sp.]